MEYQWDLAKTYVKDIDGHTDVVCGIEAKLICKDDNGNFGFYETFVPIDTSNLSTFIEFSDLTQAVLANWVGSYFTEEQLAEMRTKAAEKCCVWQTTVKHGPFSYKFK